MEQVLRNMLPNAAKYGGGEGSILLEAQDADQAVRATISDSGRAFRRTSAIGSSSSSIAHRRWPGPRAARALGCLCAGS